MKWFTHQTDSYTNLKHRIILSEFGLEGYGFYWLCCELVGQQGEKYLIKSAKQWLQTLKVTTNLPESKIQALLKRFAEINLISHNSLQKGNLYIPKMREYSDAYTKRVRRLSELSMVTIHNNTLQDIIRHYITKKGWLVQDKKLLSDIIRRNCLTAKRLYALTGQSLEQTKDAISWMSQQDYRWVLETVIKKYPDFLKTRETLKVQEKRGQEAQEKIRKMKKEAEANPIDPKALEKLTKGIG